MCAEPLRVIVNVLHILFAISIIVIVLLQSGKQAGLSGSIAGGAETFFGKNKEDDGCDAQQVYNLCNRSFSADFNITNYYK